MYKKAVTLISISALLFVTGSGCLENKDEKNRLAIIDTSKGIIKIELFEDKLPITTENFIKLATDGFYDGLISIGLKTTL